MAAFAEDLAWLCTELALTKPVVVSHSMGGNVALELLQVFQSSRVDRADLLPRPSRRRFLMRCNRWEKLCGGPDYQAAYQGRFYHWVFRLIMKRETQLITSCRRLGNVVCPRSHIR